MPHTLATACVAALVLLVGCQQAPPPAVVATPVALQAHGQEFEEAVITVAPGLHVAVGFGIANSILIEGDDGTIIVDTLESLDAAQRVAAAFAALSDLPVKAIIYTHSHPDHVQGASAFIPEGTEVPVIAHERVAANMDRVASELQPVITRRSLRMYGSGLPDGDQSNLGIGAFLALSPEAEVGILRPTHTFTDRLQVTISGVDMELVHAPGETDDQIFIWLPKYRALLPADNLYKAFPNLYTLRGTRYRDPKQWAQSLDAMRAYRPDLLIPSHGRPIIGADSVMAVLTDYRDAIRYVHDQSLRRMNAGQSPDQIAAELTLPPHLAASPYLQPFYGTTAWAARAIFQGELGWFSGNISELAPLPPGERGQRWLALTGGAETLLAEARKALAQGDPQWALELTDPLMAVAADDADVRALRADAADTLGARSSNPNARHYYLSVARELRGTWQAPTRIVNPTPAMLAAMPLATFFDGMAVALDADTALDTHAALVFDFPDAAPHTLIVRRGVAEWRADGQAPDVPTVYRCTVTAQVFKEMLAQLRNPALTLATHFEMTEGSRLDLLRFLRLFVPLDTEAP